MTMPIDLIENYKLKYQFKNNTKIFVNTWCDDYFINIPISLFWKDKIFKNLQKMKTSYTTFCQPTFYNLPK